jgi:hypothetical protein
VQDGDVRQLFLLVFELLGQVLFLPIGSVSDPGDQADSVSILIGYGKCLRLRCGKYVYVSRPVEMITSGVEDVDLCLIKPLHHVEQELFCGKCEQFVVEQIAGYQEAMYISLNGFIDGGPEGLSAGIPEFLTDAFFAAIEGGVQMYVGNMQDSERGCVHDFL